MTDWTTQTPLFVIAGASYAVGLMSKPWHVRYDDAVLTTAP